MDDHKMYYDKRDLWPVLVKAGFLPSNLKLRYHKFRLNLFASARKRWRSRRYATRRRLPIAIIGPAIGRYTRSPQARTRLSRCVISSR